jgi:hypothetical protein
MVPKSLYLPGIEPTKSNHVSSFKKCNKLKTFVGCLLKKQRRRENNERKGTQ